MANIVGKAAYVDIGGVTVAGIKNWTCDQTIDTIDVTSMSDSAPTAKSYLMGLTDATGTFDGNHTDGTPQTLGDSVTLKLYTDGTDYYSMTAFITGINSAASVDGEVTVNYSYQQSGGVTYTVV